MAESHPLRAPGLSYPDKELCLDLVSHLTVGGARLVSTLRSGTTETAPSSPRRRLVNHKNNSDDSS